jgi:hypothetical protein
MKGVKKENEKKKLERDAFVREMFIADCADRAKKQFKTPDNFYLEPLSGPNAQKAFKRRFKVPMNSQRLFRLRREVWQQCGLDSEGRPQAKRGLHGVAPLLPAVNGHGLTAAARDPNDPLFNVAIIPVEDVAQGVFLKTSIEKLSERGLVDMELRVDAITEHYATVSKFPKEPAPAALNTK